MLRKLLVVACAMFAFGFALVPFYKKICEVTGINSVVRADEIENTQVDAARWVTVEFDSNLRGLPWDFRALETSVRIHPGELNTVEFEIANHSTRPVTGQAIPSYGPQVAVRWCKKLECFCFQQQTFEAGETRRMPVTFLIDPALPASVNTITLSYTFFEVAGTRAAGKGG